MTTASAFDVEFPDERIAALLAQEQLSDRDHADVRRAADVFTKLDAKLDVTLDAAGRPVALWLMEPGPPHRVDCDPGDPRPVYTALGPLGQEARRRLDGLR